VSKQTRTIRFDVARDDVAILLRELDPREPSILYSQVFDQLSHMVAHPALPTSELHIADIHVEPFRRWLDRAHGRHAKKGDQKKAGAFARVRDSEH
jgi:hypothetical protein